jgi:hypothetical protein
MDSIRLRLTYDGKGPVHWNGGPALFGVQDKTGALDAGKPGPGGTRVFDLVLVGDIAHGSPAERFLYLSWRNLEGNYAQRLKLPLDAIASRDARTALERQSPLTATLVDRQPRATSTGANIGGSRPISWALA